MAEEEIIKGCLRNERAAQRALYEIYSPAMMQVCIRFSQNREQAKEILLDGFKNIFNNFRSFSDENTKRKKDEAPLAMHDWIKKEIIAAAVRHMHAGRKQHFVSSTVSVRDSERPASAEITDEQLIKSADKQSVIKAVQQLSHSYRTVYNLYEIENYSHAEISKLLDISEYSSKDNLQKAKFNLRKNLVRMVPQHT